MFHAGEKILDRQRFQFPPNWVYVDHVDGEWGAFNEIMKRKDLAVQGQVGSLQMKIVAEDKVVEQKTQALLQEWEREKPIQVKMRGEGEGGRGGLRGQRWRCFCDDTSVLSQSQNR